MLNVNSVRDFSNGSVAVYVPNNQYNRPETIINLNVTDTPTGIYTLKIMPATTENGTQEENFYNLLVNTEFIQLNDDHNDKESDDGTATGK